MKRRPKNVHEEMYPESIPTYMAKVLELAEKSLTPEGKQLMYKLLRAAPDIWDRLLSGSNKYHKRRDGSIPVVAEHVYWMLNAYVKTVAMWNVTLPSEEGDWRFLAILFHDVMKFGEKGEDTHTNEMHNWLGGDWMNEMLEDLNVPWRRKIIEAIDHHMGRWSDTLLGDFPWETTELTPFSRFVHILDMLETFNCLSTEE